MILSWQHKGLKRFFESSALAGIRADHAAKLGRQLRRLDQAHTPQDMNIPGWDLHSLSGKRRNFWSVKVNGNWRLIFRFNGQDVECVDYLDYH